MFNGGKFNGDEANIVGTVTADTINGTSTIISPLFNGGKFNGTEANLTNLTAVEINSTNGTYINQVEAAIFNGGIFNGDTAIISGTLT